MAGNNGEVSSTPVTFVDAVARGFRGALDFQGRASRREFWFWVLFIVLVRMVTSTIDGFIYPADVTLEVDPTSVDQGLSSLSTLIKHSLVSTTFVVELLLLVPLVAVTMRRLRDAGWKPWIAIVAYAVNYAGLFFTVSLTSSALGLLTTAGSVLSPDQAGQALWLVGQLLVVALLDLAAMIALLVGTLKPTRHIDI